MTPRSGREGMPAAERGAGEEVTTVVKRLNSVSMDCGPFVNVARILIVVFVRWARRLVLL